MKSECKHPLAYRSKIGRYSVCNLCGEKFYENVKPIEEDKPIEIKEEPIEVKEIEEVKDEIIEPEIVVEIQEPIEEVEESIEKPKKKTRKKKS